MLILEYWEKSTEKEKKTSKYNRNNMLSHLLPVFFNIFFLFFNICVYIV